MSNVYFGTLMNVLTFQFYSFVDFFNKVLQLDPNSVGNNPFNNQFNAMGYGAVYIIQNFGMLCFSVLVTPVLYLLVLFLHKIFPQELDKPK